MLHEDVIQCKNIFDVIAVSYKYIKDNENNAFLLYKSDATYSKTVDYIIKLYYEERNNTDAFSNFIKLIHNLLIREENIEAYCVAIIIHIDQKFIYEHHYTRFSKKIIEQIKALNTVISDEIIIIPRLNNNFLNIKAYNATLRKNKYYRRNTIRSELKNFIILKKIELESYNPSVNIYNNGREFRLLAEQRGINIGFVPLTKNSLLNINFKNDTFDVNGYKNNHEEAIMQKYYKAIDKAKEFNIDILIFPEMLLTKNIYESVKNYLNKSFSSLKFVFCGSIWENFSNKCYVISGNGEDILIQNKFTKFIFKNKYYENLKHNDNEMNIELLDIEGLGRIITTICIDYLDDSTMNRFMKEFACNFSIVPSYSESLSEFERHSKLFADDYHGITLVGNCCQLIFEKYKKQRDVSSENIGFVCIPAKNGHRQDSRLYYYSLDQNCIGNCEENFCLHRFQLKIDSDMIVDKNCI